MGLVSYDHKLSVHALTGTGVLQLDPWLEPFQDALKRRYSKAQQWIRILNETEGGLEKFSRGYETLGLHAHENGDITYKEWAPNALRAYVIGDFSKQKENSYKDLD